MISTILICVLSSLVVSVFVYVIMTIQMKKTIDTIIDGVERMTDLNIEEVKVQLSDHKFNK